MATVINDLKYGLRMLAKHPGFTAIALITLAIGIGANTIMFSISDLLLLLQPRKVKAPEQLVFCGLRDARFSWFSNPEYQTIRDSGLAFSDLMGQAIGSRDLLVHKGLAQKVETQCVSANYFSILGVMPARGRGFLPEEEQQGSAPVAVLSSRYWRRLGGDPKLVGEFVTLNDTACQIVGVAPAGFTGATLHGPDLWLSLGSYWTVDEHGRKGPSRQPSLELVGRLKPEMTMTQAQVQLQTLFSQFTPEVIEDFKSGRAAFHLRPTGRFHIVGDYEEDLRKKAFFSLALMSVGAIILVIACLNLANMLIVQGSARHREIAVRLAIGGGRWRIIRQLLIESLLLALLGGILGILMACFGMRILNVCIAARNMSFQVGLNGRVLGGTLGLCLIATGLFGLRPALQLSKRDIASEMKASSTRGGLGTRRRMHTGLSVAGQIALAVALVLSATLLTRSALEKARSDPRFPLDDKIVVDIDPRAAGYGQAQTVQAYRALVDHLAALPGVKAVGTSKKVFLGGGGDLLVDEYRPGSGVKKVSEAPIRDAIIVPTGRGYFQAMEIPLLQGRLFEPRDRLPNAEEVVIIDRSLAQRLRPDGNALGCLIHLGIPEFPEMMPEFKRVVGIVAHVPGIKNRQVGAQMFAPSGQNDLAPCICLHVVNKGSIDVMQQRIFDEIHRLEPRMLIFSVTTLAQRRYDDYFVWLARFGARIALTAGTAALFLAALGIYAIKGYMVAARTPEIGVRMALGATHGNIMGMVLHEGLRLTVVGLMVGLALGSAVAKVAARFLYDISPLDPVSILITVALLCAASLLAGYIPARRAAKVDPMEALRYE